MILGNQIGIIADDVTGANDTALQFQKKGIATHIALDCERIFEHTSSDGVWAISSESRNISPTQACENVAKTVKALSEKLNIEHFYKKIDSTMRGNIAPETLTMLQTLDYDAAVIIPAFPLENRITVGGYHLLKGVPIGRTEIAQDPHSPILESHIPTLLKSQLGDMADIVAHIDLKVVMNGAGPILVKMNELIKSGKKLIVADATSKVDIEQIILAINKSNYNILPTGTAATASVLSNIWLDDNNKYEKRIIPRLPKFIVSGSATNINKNQIETLITSDNYKIHEIRLSQKDIIDGVSQKMVDDIISNLQNESLVLVHSSYLLENFDGFSDDSLNEELTRTTFASKITNYLGALTQRVLEQINVMLIVLGGETSYKCCKAIGALELDLIDEVLPAIPLCVDKNNRYIITKSGNLGDSNTIINILNYIKNHEQV